MAVLPPIGVAALRMKNADPEAFDIYTAQLELYQHNLTNDLIMANQQDVLVAQGRVQVMVSIIRTLKECHLQKIKPAPTP